MLIILKILKLHIFNKQSQTENFWTYPRKVAQRAVLSAISPLSGPVQINVPLRDPLVPELKSENYEKGRSRTCL